MCRKPEIIKIPDLLAGFTVLPGIDYTAACCYEPDFFDSRFFKDKFFLEYLVEGWFGGSVSGLLGGFDGVKN